ncbi:MAG: 4Fe-4S dicluster domain-containing protein [Lentisphaeria bacterium]|nr:4Fe-4S dicluster domain-containing protein [Lentisphaeria bacterium]
MWNSLKARLFQGYRTGKFPYTAPVLPDHFSGRPEIAVDKCSQCGKCAEVCPTAAAIVNGKPVVIDTGKCLFCGKCAEVCPENAVTISKEYRLAAMTRENLLVTGSSYLPERPTDREFLRFCGKSLKIRQVSAGGCAACELDFNVLNTLAWDMGRFGIQVVASPRHADCILVTGPVSENMLLALKKSYDAAPRPVWVIACGTCAISGGIYAGSEVCHDGVEKILKPDLYVPGCPPHPATLLEGILRLMDKKF